MQDCTLNLVQIFYITCTGIRLTWVFEIVEKRQRKQKKVLFDEWFSTMTSLCIYFWENTLPFALIPYCVIIRYSRVFEQFELLILLPLFIELHVLCFASSNHSQISFGTYSNLSNNHVADLINFWKYFLHTLDFNLQKRKEFLPTRPFWDLHNEYTFIGFWENPSSTRLGTWQVKVIVVYFKGGLQPSLT